MQQPLTHNATGVTAILIYDVPFSGKCTAVRFRVRYQPTDMQCTPTSSRRRSIEKLRNSGCNCHLISSNSVNHKLVVSTGFLCFRINDFSHKRGFIIRSTAQCDQYENNKARQIVFCFIAHSSLGPYYSLESPGHQLWMNE
jgi:hypothetical protein